MVLLSAHATFGNRKVKVAQLRSIHYVNKGIIITGTSVNRCLQLVCTDKIHYGMNSYAEAKRVPTEKGNTRIVSVNS